MMVGIMLPVLLGFGALGTEGVMLLQTQRQMQSAADSAAVGGVIAKTAGNPADYTAEVRAEAAEAGFVNGAEGVTVTANSPPTGGSHAGASGFVEAIISQPQSVPLMRLLTTTPFTVSARAVAQAGGGSYCALALNTGTVKGVDMSNGVSVDMNQCGLAVNAKGSNALSVIGGSVLNAQSVSVVGSANVNNGGSINATNGVKTAQAKVTDPYAGVAIPAYSGCKYGAKNNPTQVLGWQNPTLKPDGVYCGGISMGSGGTVKMDPGVYIINGGKFSLQGGTTLTGTGVTIVLTGSSSAGYATMDFGNGATATLSAPTSGATAGLVFFQDPKAPKTGFNNNVQGGTNMVLTGALYFPSQTVNYSNGSSTASTCTQLIAWQIVFTGGAEFNSNCGTAGTKSIGGSSAHLVE